MTDQPGRFVARSPWAADHEADLYERGRPEYPGALSEVLAEQLSLRPGCYVADVAAGTGKLTRVLEESPATVVAIEPQPGMRRRAQTAVSGATVLAGKAERLPLRSGSLAAITVGQAFHWFSVTEATHEFHRVLRPGGRLAVVSNQRHEPQEWVKQLWSILQEYERLAPNPGSNRGWRQVLQRTGQFGPFSRFELPNQQRFDDLTDFDARFASVSFVLMLDDDVRASLLHDLHKVVENVDPIVIPLRTVVEIADRID